MGDVLARGLPTPFWVSVVSDHRPGRPGMERDAGLISVLRVRVRAFANWVVCQHSESI